MNSPVNEIQYGRIPLKICSFAQGEQLNGTPLSVDFPNGGSREVSELVLGAYRNVSPEFSVAS